MKQNFFISKLLHAKTVIEKSSKRSNSDDASTMFWWCQRIKIPSFF